MTGEEGVVPATLQRSSQQPAAIPASGGPSQQPAAVPASSQQRFPPAASGSPSQQRASSSSPSQSPAAVPASSQRPAAFPASLQQQQQQRPHWPACQVASPASGSRAPVPDAEETSTSSQHLFDNFIVPTDAFEPGRRSSLPSSDTEEHVRKQRSPRRRKRRRRSPTGSQSVATRDDEDDTQAADISTQRSADNFHDEQDVSQDGTTMEVATHNVTIGAPVETPVSPPTTPDLSHHDAIPMNIGQTHGTGAWADDIEEGTPPPPDELPPPDEAAC
ncbi:translation initiation factor IF-2-like [Schistocerca piceifrons]|uniref:translation initiation factor IF-2-like n=1 Tax=Schistocerca piceifrons TaxID=274613 RepID=UPI001F5F89C0|nr:translation initiation factor IF-2-like [Schistocerca piceifrons]